MFPKIDPTGTKAWNLLELHSKEMKEVHMRELFAKDAERYKKHAHCFNDILVDFSKNIITDETLKLLLQLANECKLKDAIESMFEGDKINQTKQRSELHVALRNNTGKPLYSQDKKKKTDVKRVQEQMKGFCKKVH